MATETDNLIARLTLEAAFGMEDAAPLLVCSWPDNVEEQQDCIDYLREAADVLSALATAVRAVHTLRSHMRHEAR